VIVWIVVLSSHPERVGLDAEVVSLVRDEAGLVLRLSAWRGSGCRPVAMIRWQTFGDWDSAQPAGIPALKLHTLGELAFLPVFIKILDTAFGVAADLVMPFLNVRAPRSPRSGHQSLSSNEKIAPDRGAHVVSNTNIFFMDRP